MANCRGSRNAYYFFTLEKLPELKQQGLAVTNVANAIPYCSDAWALLNEEQKERYAEMARRWKATKSEVVAEKPRREVLVPFPTQTQDMIPVTNLTSPFKNEQVVLETSFYFLNIFSHGVLPPHCNQRFLPCEIGCIKYSLTDGIIAEFHHFINPGEVPRGFRFHCQAAGDATHKIPITGFDTATASYSVVLHDLYEFIKPQRGNWPSVYCKSDDHFRVNWCLKYMAKETGRVNHLKLLNVEDLVVELYYKKLQKEPSKTWVCNTLDASMWDYSGNTRCEWHEKNDIVFCALATCKKIAYCISNSLANMYEIHLTASHLPLTEKNCKSTTNPKMIVLDARRFQKGKIESTGNDSYFRSLNKDHGATPCSGVIPSGVKTMHSPIPRSGRGIAQFLESTFK
ncbi:protein maelstrom homolog [Notechis scutatus]|uniref:Protein maelstrom homolog n=1 Tax=Notechis scutatus TaxID=8663 RepID=A0A6J1TPM2_9SAUR|nr:protein maelstrom homolog [Notechis scutatus]